MVLSNRVYAIISSLLIVQRKVAMRLFFKETSIIHWQENSYLVSATLKQMLMLATIITILWWSIGLVRPMQEGDTIRWADQADQYLQGIEGLINPYDVPGFFNAPWAMVIMFPFNLVPFEIAILLQGILYHCVLTIIAYKFCPAHFDEKSRRLATLAILTSPFPADLALELNNDWIPALGLLVPSALSPIFILTKPQNAIGYFLAFEWKPLMRAILVGSATIILSFFIWGHDWILRAYDSIQTDSLGTDFSAAPITLIGVVPSLLIGTLIITYVLYRVHFKPRSNDTIQHQRDMALYAIVGGFFFTPYIAGYSLALIYALLGAKVPRIMLAFNIVLWIFVLALLSLAFL